MRPATFAGSRTCGRSSGLYLYRRTAANLPWRSIVAVVGVVVLLAIPAGSMVTPSASKNLGMKMNVGTPVVTPAGNGTASGRGSFYQSAILPKAAAPQDACYQSVCVNATTDPTMNLTSTGLLAVAYTSYSYTSSCPYAQSEVAITTSSDAGQTWSAPVYQDGPDCGTGSAYNSSWEPSLTSLANGTLVLAYIQYNLSASASYPYPPDFEWGDYDYTVPYDRLVLTESYDDGATWTTPEVLVSSKDPSLNPSNFSSPLRPYVAATGNTIYVAWTNISAVPYVGSSCGAGVSCIQNVGPISASFMASTDGGQSWGPVKDLNPENVSPIAINASVNPTITVLPSGQLTIAYIGNITGQSPFCEPSYCQNWGINPGYWGLEGGQIVVARSMDNGTTLNYSLVPLNPSNEPLWFTNPSATPTSSAVNQYPRGMALSNPYPSMTYDASSGQLYIAVEAGNLSEVTGWNEETTVFVTNSSTSGATWTPVRQVDPSLIQAATGGCYYLSGGPGGCASQAEGDASVVVSNGSLVVAFGYYDYQACGTNVAGSTECGMVEELVYNSTDNGYSFTPAGVASTVSTVDDELYAGASASAIGTGSNLWIAWTQPWCPDWTTLECAWPQAGPDGPQVLVSQPYEGAGLTVQFQTSGLASGLDWSVIFGGLLRTGNSAATLSISGVPPNTAIAWEIPNAGVVNSTQYGLRYTVISYSLPSPSSFTADTTVTVTFSDQYRVDLGSSPSHPIWTQAVCGVESTAGTDPAGPFCWDDPYDSDFNYNITVSSTPSTTVTLGENWVAPGTRVTVAANLQAGYCDAGTCTQLNLSFGGWVGVGGSSVTGPSSAVTVDVQDPVNETAMFQATGTCVVTGTTGAPITYQCSGLDYTLSFVESGLPLGTTWGVTTSTAVENGIGSNESSLPWLNVTASSNAGVVTYRAWSVPAPGGAMWIPNSTYPASPVELPGQAIVHVNYTLQDPNATSFVTQIRESGLPNWVSGYSMSIGGTNYGVPGATTNLTLNGGNYSVSASPVYRSNGTGFYLQSITIQPDVTNWSIVTTPVNSTGSILIAGPAVVTLNFGNLSYLSVQANHGGSANESSQWVELGQSVTLSATPSSNYTFLQWTGSGPGSNTSLEPTIRVTPTGPITEVATFKHFPPVTYIAVVSVAGLPADTPATVEIGGLAYTSANATFVVTGLNGTYAFSVPTIYANENNLTRYLPANVTTTFPVTAGSITVTGPGTIQITYEAQYAVTLMATGDGTIHPGAGTRWANRSATLVLTAIPGAGFQSVGWIGTGNGSVTSSALTIHVTVIAPISEIVTFVAIPSVTPTSFRLTVTESGLPSGTKWSFSLGSIGGAGGNRTLELDGLNGRYTLEVPTVYVGPGTRFVANISTETVVLTASNQSATVSFAAEYGVTVASSGGGHATSSVADWATSGDPVTFTATASSGWEFVGWTGTGPGSATSGSSTVTVTVSGGPVTEKALFAPVPAPRTNVTTTPSTTRGAPLDVGILVALLVAGLAVGFVLTRGRGGGGAREDHEAPDDGSDADGEAASEMDSEEPS